MSFVQKGKGKVPPACLSHSQARLTTLRWYERIYNSSQLFLSDSKWFSWTKTVVHIFLLWKPHGIQEFTQVPDAHYLFACENFWSRTKYFHNLFFSIYICRYVRTKIYALSAFRANDSCFQKFLTLQFSLFFFLFTCMNVQFKWFWEKTNNACFGKKDIPSFSLSFF